MSNSLRPHGLQPARLLCPWHFSRQESWSELPFPSPVHESEKWKCSRLVMSDSSWSHGLQPTRLLRPWDFPGKRTGVDAIAFSGAYTAFSLLFMCCSHLRSSHCQPPFFPNPNVLPALSLRWCVSDTRTFMLNVSPSSHQRPPTFLAPGSVFMEDNFFMDQGGGCDDSSLWHSWYLISTVATSAPPQTIRHGWGPLLYITRRQIWHMIQGLAVLLLTSFTWCIWLHHLLGLVLKASGVISHI